MGYRRVLSKWTPHALTYHDRAARVTIAKSLLLHPHRKDFLNLVVTGDESWVCYNNTAWHAYWIPSDAELSTQLKVDPHDHKVMLSVLWDSQGIFFWELLEENERVNANVYTEQLQKLADAVREKRPKRLEVALLHDSAKPHTAKLTQEFLKSLGWTTVPCPAYSPDLTPSDYHLFRALKQHLREKSFKDYNDLKSDINGFLLSQPVSFWRKGIEALPSKWLGVFDNDGDYIVDL